MLLLCSRLIESFRTLHLFLQHNISIHQQRLKQSLFPEEKLAYWSFCRSSGSSNGRNSGS